MKQTGLLVVSLRGVNFGFWSHLGFRAKCRYFKPPRSRLGFSKETQNYAKRNKSQVFFFLLFFSFLSGLFYGSKFAYATPRWPPLGVKFKISNEHPHLFHIGDPPPPWETYARAIVMHLRVNFTYYQTDDGRSQKIDFVLFSSTYSP